MISDSSATLSCGLEPGQQDLKKYTTDCSSNLEDLQRGHKKLENTASVHSSAQHKKVSANKTKLTSGVYDKSVNREDSANIFSEESEDEFVSDNALDSEVESDASLGGSFYSVNTDISDRFGEASSSQAAVLTSISSIASQFYSAETLFNNSKSNLELNINRGSNESFLSVKENSGYKSNTTLSEWYEASPYYQQIDETPSVSCPNIHCFEEEDRKTAKRKSKSHFNLEYKLSKSKNPSTQTLTAATEMNIDDDVPSTPVDEDLDKKTKPGFMSSFRKSKKGSKKSKSDKNGDNEESTFDNEGDNQQENTSTNEIKNDENSIANGSEDISANEPTYSKKFKIKSPLLSRSEKIPKSPKSPRTPKSKKKLKEKLAKQDSFIDLDDSNRDSDVTEKVEEKEGKKKSKKGLLSRKERKNSKSEEQNDISKENEEGSKEIFTDDAATPEPKEKEGKKKSKKSFLGRKERRNSKSDDQNDNVLKDDGEESKQNITEDATSPDQTVQTTENVVEEEASSKKSKKRLFKRNKSKVDSETKNKEVQEDTQGNEENDNSMVRESPDGSYGDWRGDARSITSSSEQFQRSEGRDEPERGRFQSSSYLTDSWAGASTDKKEHLYKILVIGELGTGKTSIIKRYVHQFFSQHYRATIGVDFALKVLNWDSNTVIRLQLWDIAGQERFGNMTRVYYKEAVGAFVVFDVTRSQTFDAVTKWKTDLDTKVTLPDGTPIPTVMLANKCDQPKEGVVNNPSRMDDFCKEKGFTGWFETSAKDNINIDEAARFLVNKILMNEKQGLMMNESLDAEKFSLNSSASQGSGCAC